MKQKTQNRIEELVERNSFRLDYTYVVEKEKNSLNTLRSSKNQKTLKGSRRKEPAIK